MRDGSGMLELARGLSPRALEALAALERRAVAIDGGRLKLEWGTLRSRKGDDVEDVLWWDGDRLLGFLGIYAFAAPTVELVGVVDPEARRRGIASALLDAALPLVRERGHGKTLLVTPRDSEGGAAFARARGAVLEHSEHALVLLGAPRARRDDTHAPELTVRDATVGDVPTIEHLLGDAFDYQPDDVAARLFTETARTLVVVVAGDVAGTVRVTRESDTGGIYGFAVDRRRRGQGIGREVLRRVCLELHEEGMARIGLEVAVHNESALGLYTSVGFERVTTEDYYELTRA